MFWGVDGGRVDEKRLTPLGLVCDGGRSNKNGETTYHVYDKKGFDIYLVKKDFDNVGEIYKKFKMSIRIDKLKKINNI